MPNLSAQGNQLVQTLAQKHGVSNDAVTHMLIAVHNGNGSMAQFNHPEFGGGGQWMQGGMTMVSDLFNNYLKCQVNNICSDIANELANHQLVPFSGSFQSQSQNGSSGQSQAAGSMGSSNSLFVPDPTTNWWPKELGSPTAIGSQNQTRYAYFPNSHRLAVTTGGDAWVYDTLNHQIGGFSQQQGSGGSITFSSQFGTVDLSSLPIVSIGGVPQTQPQPAPVNPIPPAAAFSTPLGPSPNQGLSDAAEMHAAHPVTLTADDDVISTLDRLGALKEKGYITEEEFASKKADLLGRL